MTLQAILKFEIKMAAVDHEAQSALLLHSPLQGVKNVVILENIATSLKSQLNFHIYIFDNSLK